MFRNRPWILMAGIISVLLAGCDLSRTHTAAMNLEATRTNLNVNESATVLVRSENTLGERPKIDWSTTLGKVTPVREGMLDFRPDKPTAIFTSDKPGEAVVTARLTLDNGTVLSDSVKINVNPIR